MKQLIILVLTLLCTINLWSQSETTELLQKDGLLIHQEPFVVGKVNSIQLERIQLKSIWNESVTTAIKVIHDSYPKTFSGIIDKDEVQNCSKALKYIHDIMINEPSPAKGSKITYITKGGLIIGAYTSDYVSGPKKGQALWTLYIQPNSKIPDSKFIVQKEEMIADLISLFQKAQEELK